MNTLSKSIILSIGILGSFALLSLPTAAQSIMPQTEAGCGFDHRHQQKLLTNEGYARAVSAFNNRNHEQAIADRDAGTLFVPLVVHVLETGTANTAITDDQVRLGVKWLNERYRKVAGTSGAGAGVDTHIEFALAVRDPNGNCTNGITRHNMSANTAYINGGVQGAGGISDDAVKAIGAWDSERYYNIWLVNFIDDGGTNGYAYFASSHGETWDGTVMATVLMKDPVATTLAHEIGHALNLYHTFEGDANGTTCPPNATCATQGDLVCDTPPHIRTPGTCDVSGTNSCDGGSSNALFRRNYLDYSSAACRNMFTAGQDTRIQSALIVDRASLLASNGNMSLVPVSAPVMDISASASALCGTGQSVQFFDNSTCIPNTFLRDPDLPGITFAWTITNGVNTYTSDQQNPVVTLGSTGAYSATLTTTTSLGTYTRTEQGIVVVTANPVAACIPTSLNPSANYGLTVSRVVFNTIDNSTSTGINFPYTDHACTQNTVVAPGQTYPLSVTLNGVSGNTEIFQAYIDWNNNGTFEDPSELVGSGSQGIGQGTVTVNVTIPGGAVTNTLLRLRVYGETGSLSAAERTCSTALLVADVEDYGIYVSNSLARVTIAASPSSTVSYGTNVTFTPTPVNGGGSPVYNWFRNGAPVATGASYSTNDLVQGETIHCSMASSLSTALASPALSNTITMTVTGAPLTDFTANRLMLCAGGTVSFSDASLLAPTSWSWSFPGGTPATSSVQNPVITYNTPGTYTVTLTASNGLGTGTTQTKTAHISVSATPTTGCIVTRSTPPAAGIGITRVRLNTIDHRTAYDDAAMNNFTCSQITTLTPGATYTIKVNVGTANNQWVRAYIDLNGDGDFLDANELVFAPANGVGVRTGTFTVPASPPVLNSLLRMRVITDFVNTSAGPCTTPVQYGQVEEYGVVIEGPTSIALAAKLMLEGPYDPNSGLMNDALRSGAMLPSAEPFTAMGYSFVGGGGETVLPAVLAVTGNNAIVDWVIVELRDNATPTTIVASKAALLQRDGDVVATDGTSPISFTLPSANYRVAVLHRNHLGAMTQNGVLLTASPTMVNLASNATTTYGTDARRSISGTFPTEALWAGDANFDGEVLYTGGDNDRDLILVRIGGTIPTNEVVGYDPADVNMDGIARYTGGDNDRDRVLQTIGGVVPTTVRTAQLP